MATKLMDKIHKYFNNIWLIEIIYLVIFILCLIFNVTEDIKYSNEFFGYKGEDWYRTYEIIFSLVAAVIFVKIIVVLFKYKKNIVIRGNFLFSFIYVWKNGLKFKHTKKMLFNVILIDTIIFIIYLYVIAMKSSSNNILSRFFYLYPIKGILIVLIVPTIAVIYVIKKNIEISKVNEKIPNIESSSLKEDINSQTSDEVVQLIENISAIKIGYENAVDETLKNERLKTELISNVSHDLRTPLTSIINYVNILSDKAITEEEREEYLKILDSKSKKLKILIDDLFEMSKINSGKIELHKERIDIMSLIHQAIGEYSCLYEEKNINFNVESFKEEIYMMLDGKMISRAIENVVINALKYSLKNTRIYIEVNCKNKMIEISFKNIANYYMDFDNDEIFERFARGDKSRNSKVEGSGLGLAITKSIVELHQGDIRIKREGDMFKIYIYLPLEEN